MINTAMFRPNPDDLNEFTRALLDKILMSKADRLIPVKLRNGRAAYVTYDPAELQFHSQHYDRVWRLDGSSVSSDELDMIELED